LARRVLPALGILLAALCLGGCGGSSSTQGQGTRSSEQSTTQSPPAEQNAEASIEGFGAEAEGSERKEVLGAFRAYLGALSAHQYASACAYLAPSVRQALSQLGAKVKRSPNCPELLEALLSPRAAPIAKAQEEGKVAKVRVKGDTAFVVFHAPGARLWQLTLAKEGAGWKATSLSAAVLAPSLPK
jgi:hypothetical protein